LRLAEAEVFDVWRRQYLGQVVEELVLRGVPAHGCRLLALSPADGRPRVLGTSFHIGQGVYELAEEVHDQASGSLSLKIDPTAVRQGSLWVSWPGPRKARVDGPFKAVDDLGAALRIDLTVDAQAELLVRPA
jgi:hypothetical protein